MKRKDLAELRQKTAAELKPLLLKEKKDLVKLRMDLALKKAKNFHLIGGKRKTIAQILTLIGEKEQTL